MDKKKKIAIFVIVLSIALIGIGIFLLSGKKYTVEIVTDSNIKTVEVKEGELVTKPADPVKKGYKFVGWYVDGKIYDFSKKVTSNLKIEAKWEKVEEDSSDSGDQSETVKKYKVTFKDDDGKVLSTIEVKENDTIVAKPDDPSKEGYNFIGWFDGDKEYKFTEKVTEELTLIAKYEKIPENVKTYTVTFDSDGGTKIGNKVIEEGKTVTKPTNPTKTGYSFVSWQLDGKDYDFSTPITKNITLKANWKQLNKYTITFDLDGGTGVASASVYEGSKLTKPANPTKYGYDFVSWQLDGTNFDFNTAITKNLTLKATWKEKTKCTVTFDSNGGSTVNNITVYCGSQVGNLPTPTKAENTFDGWYSGSTKYTSTTVVNSSVTLKAKWTNNNEALLNSALASLKNVEITKGGQSIEQTYSGCTIVSTPSESIAKIKRELTDKNITISVSVTCGSLSGNKNVTGIIKASPLKYTATANENQVNYNVSVLNGSATQTNYTLYKNGSYLAEYSSNDGYAAVNNADISGFPNLTLKFKNDSNTSYVVSKK